MERERELLKQIECLTKEMTEALNARDAANKLASKAEDANKKLHDTLAEERAEAVRSCLPPAACLASAAALAPRALRLAVAASP